MSSIESYDPRFLNFNSDDKLNKSIRIEMMFREMAIRKGAHEEYTCGSLSVLWERAVKIEDFVEKKINDKEI